MLPISHVEIPASDLESAREFYTILFGWKLEPVEDVANSMWAWVPCANSEEGGMAAIITQRAHPEQEITNYIQVPSIHEYASRVKSLNGEVVVPPTEAPGKGYFCLCLDPDKNVFGLWQPIEKE